MSRTYTSDAMASEFQGLPGATVGVDVEEMVYDVVGITDVTDALIELTLVRSDGTCTYTSLELAQDLLKYPGRLVVVDIDDRIFEVTGARSVLGNFIELIVLRNEDLDG